MLGADGELEELRGVGGAFVEVGGHFVGVVQLVGDCVIAVAAVGDADAAGILRVGFVDERKGFGEFVAWVGGCHGWRPATVAHEDGLLSVMVCG